MKKLIKLMFALLLFMIIAPVWGLSVYWKFFTFGMVFKDDPTNLVYYIPDATAEPNFKFFVENFIPKIPYPYYTERFADNPSAKCFWSDENDLPPFYEYFTSIGWLIQTILFVLNILAIFRICKTPRTPPAL